jgi:hypothetical protein
VTKAPIRCRGLGKVGWKQGEISQGSGVSLSTIQPSSLRQYTEAEIASEAWAIAYEIEERRQHQRRMREIRSAQDAARATRNRWWPR